jgi:CheY-like chemotaxis protein
MPADLLPRVFDLFSQGERTLDRSQGGLGIGLTLVRNLVDMHGGQVTAISPGPGLGSTFRLRLPLAAAADADPAKPAATPPGVRVLVVDDDPAVAESTEVFLAMEGHAVRTAASGEAALELLADFQPEVVLLDLGLPGLDGYATASRLRQLPGGDRLRLIAVSGYGSEEVISRCRAAGFDQHLVKPINPAALAALLKNAGRQAAPASAPTA